MSQLCRIVAVSVASLLFLVTCRKDPVGPVPVDGARKSSGATVNAENDNVVLFGRVVSVGEGEFVIDIARPAATNDGAEILWSEVLPGRGVSGRPLPISTGINTTFSGGSLANLEVGTPVMLGGQLREGRLDAHFVVDARGLQVDASQLREAVPSATWQPGPPLSLPPSLHEKTGVSVHDRVNAPATERTLEFPGSFGGPSWAADSGHLGIPVSLVPYIEIDRIKPVVGLAGGHYNFPFALGAMAPNTLVVGQDGNVQIKVEPKSPENEPYSYYWALGFNFEFVFNFCGFEGLFPPEWVCHSYSYDASVLSQVCATDKPAPMPGETLDIPHLACPGFGIEIEGTPISLIEVQVCQDQSFVGDCFWANVFHSPCDFGRTPREFSVRPFTNLDCGRCYSAKITRSCAPFSKSKRSEPCGARSCKKTTPY